MSQSFSLLADLEERSIYETCDELQVKFLLSSLHPNHHSSVSSNHLLSFLSLFQAIGPTENRNIDFILKYCISLILRNNKHTIRQKKIADYN